MKLFSSSRAIFPSISLSLSSSSFSSFWPPFPESSGLASESHASKYKFYSILYLKSEILLTHFVLDVQNHPLEDAKPPVIGRHFKPGPDAVLSGRFPLFVFTSIRRLLVPALRRLCGTVDQLQRRKGRRRRMQRNAQPLRLDIICSHRPVRHVVPVGPMGPNGLQDVVFRRFGLLARMDLSGRRHPGRLLRPVPISSSGSR